MKKILYLIPLFLLFLIPKVHALPNCSLINNAQLYDVNSASSIGAINTSTYYPQGSMLCEKTYHTTATSDSSHGLGWSIRLSELYPKDYNYQISVYFHLGDEGGGSPYIIESPFRNNRIALSDYSLATNNWLNGNYNVDFLQYNYSNYTQYGNIRYTVITYITKANINFSYLFIPFATDRLWTGSFYLAGIEIKSLGQSSLTSSEVNNLLTQQSNQIKDDLDSLSDNFNNKLNSIESGVNNKLDDVNSSIGETNDKLDDVNSNITNSNSSGATNSAGGFFNNFEDNDFGLSGIITAPLNTIKTITNNSCTPLNLTIPFVDKEMSLPCMTDIYEEHFGSFLDIYQIITFGIISYWVCVQIYAMVKGFKNPDKDEIEVMDL